jgi:putative two-component system response regulator
MDGFQTIAQLKQDPLLKQIPVIFLTGNSDTDTEIKALESGAMDFIVKPANTDILYHRIELHLQFSAYHLHLEKTVKELEDNIGASFAELIECKDENVAGHVLRTGKYIEFLANELMETGIFWDQLSSADVDMMARAAPFHDIGKIGVSDIILKKKDALTDEEYEKVKRHTIIGARVLETIYKRTPNQTYLEYARLIAEGHHERYDGKGYPHGKAGESIPLCCRLMSVVNVYDACMTDRIYRKALSHEEALEVIIKGSGTEFDPRIVKVFESASSKFARLNEELQQATRNLGRSFHLEADTGS